jgi:hypothetical protein
MHLIVGAVLVAGFARFGIAFTRDMEAHDAHG